MRLEKADNSRAGAGTPGGEKPRFLVRLPGVLVYPVQGQGKYVIAAGSAFLWVLSVLRRVVDWLAGSINPYAAGMIGIVFGAITGALACVVPAYVLEVIARSGDGQREPPDWPEVSDWWDDLLHPAFLIVGTGAVAFLPAALARAALHFGWVNGQWLLWALLGAGALYFPMALLGVALFGGAAGLSPHVVLPAIVKVGPAYLPAVVAVFAALGAGGVLARYVIPAVPWVGELVTAAVSLYLMMVVARVLGVLYHAYRRRLGWFE